MALEYRIIPVTDFAQNCSLIWDPQSMEGAFIDPGGDEEELLSAARLAGVKIVSLLLTHGHLDHVGAAATLAAQLDVPVIGPHQADQFWFEQLPGQAAAFSLPVIEPFLPRHWLKDGDKVSIGQQTLQVLHCPGHTPGHVVFYHAPSRLAFVGDVLFRGGIGRSDFPGGNHAELLDSIRHKLLTLGDDITFVPGHGPLSTFGHERTNNPFLQE